MQATREQDRITNIDVLRGFALLGVFVANIQIISGAVRAPPLSELDSATRSALAVLVDGSFFPLFSFLFGVGLTLQLRRADARGQRLTGRYVRRLAALMVIALAHWILVWDATILISYAALGLPLLAFGRRSPRALMVAAALCMMAQIMSWPLSRAADRVVAEWTDSRTAGAAYRAWEDTDSSVRSQASVSRLRDGSYGDAVGERAERLVTAYLRPQRYYPWAYGSIFAMFLLGVLAARRSTFAAPTRHLGVFRALLVASAIVAIASKVGAVIIRDQVVPDWGSGVHTMGVALERLGGPLLAFAYAGGLLLALRSTLGRVLRGALAPLGRMALTNYVLFSVLATAIFYGHGLALYGRLGAGAAVLIAVGLYLAQAAVSDWWLRTYRFGPLEWLWRSATYGRWQPMRRRDEVGSTVTVELG